MIEHVGVTAAARGECFYFQGEILCRGDMVMPGYWQLVLGILFVLVILFLKGGVAGAITRALSAGRRS